MKWLLEHWLEVGGILGYLGAPLGFLFGRKRAIAETRITQTDAVKNMQDAYDGWVQDDKERYAELKKEVDEMKKENSLGRRESLAQREEIRAMRKLQIEERKEYEGLMKKYIDLDKKYSSLKNAFERLKKKYDDKINQTPSDGN